MSDVDQTQHKRATPGHPGPPLAAPAAAFLIFFLAPSFLGPLLGAVGQVPSPFLRSEVVQAYFAANPHPTQLSALLMFWSALALALLTAIAHSRLDYLSPNAPGPTIAAAGGIVASAMLAVSSACTWVLGQPVTSDQRDLTHVLHYLSFVSGGPIHTAALGFLVFGLSITTWFLRRTPRWLCIVGYVIAAVAVLSSLTMAVPALAPLIPLGRFTAMIWLVAVGLLIPRSRQARVRPAATSS